MTDKNSNMLYEHIVYAEKGIPSLTLSAAKQQEHESAIHKYSILDRDLCTFKLASVLDVLSEALMQTIAIEDVRDLKVSLLLDNEGHASGDSDK